VWGIYTKGCVAPASSASFEAVRFEQNPELTHSAATVANDNKAMAHGPPRQFRMPLADLDLKGKPDSKLELQL